MVSGKWRVRTTGDAQRCSSSFLATRHLASILATPPGDRRVISAEQDLGDAPSTELSRPCVLGILEAAIGPERLIDRALGVSQDAGYEADDGVDHHHGRDLASREDEVTD